jgi:hypothetical protein
MEECIELINTLCTSNLLEAYCASMFCYPSAVTAKAITIDKGADSKQNEL